MSSRKTETHKTLSLQQKVQLINDYEKSKLSVAEFARIEQKPTVDEIISALRIVRKFSPKNNLIKEIESLRSIEKKCQAEQLANKRQQPITSFLL